MEKEKLWKKCTFQIHLCDSIFFMMLFTINSKEKYKLKLSPISAKMSIRYPKWKNESKSHTILPFQFPHYRTYRTCVLNAFRPIYSVTCYIPTVLQIQLLQNWQFKFKGIFTRNFLQIFKIKTYVQFDKVLVKKKHMKLQY